MKKRILLASITLLLSIGFISSNKSLKNKVLALEENETETSINYLELYNDNYLLFNLSASNNYPISEVLTSENTDKVKNSFLNNSNINTNIKVNGDTNAFIDYTVLAKGCIGICLASDYRNDAIQEVNILKGTKFPTMSYLSGGDESYYVTTEQINFYRDNNNYFYSIEETSITAFCEKNITETNSFFVFTLSNNDYGTACENMRQEKDKNYFNINNNVFSSYAHLKDHIYLDDSATPMSQNYEGEWFSNQFDINSSFSFRKTGNYTSGCVYNKITIKAGASFPSREFFLNNSPVYKYYVTTEDYTFTRINAGTFALKRSVIETETSVSKIEAGESFLIIYPTVNDYPSNVNTNFISNSASDTSEMATRLNNSTSGNWGKLIIDDKEISQAAGVAIINVWGRQPSIAFYAVTGAGNYTNYSTITIPKGYTFPSYEYVVNGEGEVRAYVVKEDIKFELHEGKWYKEGEYVEPTYIDVTVEAVYTEAYQTLSESYTWVHFVLSSLDGTTAFTCLDEQHWDEPTSCNQNSHVLVNDTEQSYQTYAYGYGWKGNSHTYSIRLANHIAESMDKITFKEGLRIPSYNYVINGGETTYYKVKEEISFYLYNLEKSPIDYDTNKNMVGYYGGEVFASTMNTLKDRLASINKDNYRSKDQESITAKIDEINETLDGILEENNDNLNKIVKLDDELTTFMADFKLLSDWQEIYDATEIKIKDIEDSIDESDYDEDALSLITSYIQNVKDEYKNLDTEEDINALLKTCKDNIASVVTKSQMEALKQKISEAKVEISAYKDDVKYQEKEAQDRLDIINDALTALENAKGEAQIANILSTAKDDIDALKTEAEILKEEAKELIEETLLTLNSYMDDIDIDAYISENYQKIILLVDKAKDDVSNADNIEQVNSIMDKLESDIANIETIDSNPEYDPNAPFEDDDNDSKSTNGCTGSIINSSILLSVFTLLAFILLIFKRKDIHIISK